MNDLLESIGALIYLSAIYERTVHSLLANQAAILLHKDFIILAFGRSWA